MSDYNRGYEKLEAAEKLVIPEDLRGAYKTILELIKKGITLPWFGNREQRELIERIAQLEAQLSLLQWTAIEEGNLPTRGDEVLELGNETHGPRVIPVGLAERATPNAIRTQAFCFAAPSTLPPRQIAVFHHQPPANYSTR